MVRNKNCSPRDTAAAGVVKARPSAKADADFGKHNDDLIKIGCRRCENYGLVEPVDVVKLNFAAIRRPDQNKLQMQKVTDWMSVPGRGRFRAGGGRGAGDGVAAPVPETACRKIVSALLRKADSRRRRASFPRFFSCLHKPSKRPKNPEGHQKEARSSVGKMPPTKLRQFRMVKNCGELGIDLVPAQNLHKETIDQGLKSMAKKEGRKIFFRRCQMHAVASADADHDGRGTGANFSTRLFPRRRRLCYGRRCRRNVRSFPPSGARGVLLLPGRKTNYPPRRKRPDNFPNEDMRRF